MLTNMEREELYQLRDEVEELRDRITSMQNLLLPEKLDLRFEIGLTPMESKLTVCLMKHHNKIVSKDRLFDWLYSLRASHKDIPGLKIVDVLVCKIRKKLEVFGWSITTHWGTGYSITTEDTKSILEMKGLTLEDLAA